jgi:hypothetical protein
MQNKTAPFFLFKGISLAEKTELIFLGKELEEKTFPNGLPQGLCTISV